MKSIEELLAITYPKKEITSELQKELNELKYGKICPKCHGSKVILDYLYNKNGKCFTCNGKGRIK